MVWRMNWIEIDKILYGIIARHDAVEDMLSEAKKQFKWSDLQAQAAVLPLLKRNTVNNIVAGNPKKPSKRLTKRK
jgi:hypothetical protein